jgi:hypothetical protein
MSLRGNHFLLHTRKKVQGMSSYISKNSKERYGMPNKDEVLDIIGSICFEILCIAGIVLIVISK